MKIFNIHQFSVDHHNGCTTLTAEASELGLKPGEWPEQIEITCDKETIRMNRTTLGDGGARYEQPLTKVAAIIFND